MKQAVVVIHGMGEQIPMQTIMGFTEAVWATDSDLVDPARPDSATGGRRERNAIWYKPDARNRSYELRRLTTESLAGRGSTDFYEFYWAHLMHGTAWEHFQAWLSDLLWRSPRRVPRGLGAAWTLLWLLTIAAAAAAILALIPVEGKGWAWSVLTGIATLAVGWFVNTFLLKYFGDVARYVKAAPTNVARRQEIREKGVELLETLMGIAPGGTVKKSDYDRVVVVAHSLGTIIAYDILAYCFARLNTRMTPLEDQPERAKLEEMVRAAAGLPDASGKPKPLVELDIDTFQGQQASCLTELNAQGSSWIISDFVTLGSPLAHAEVLLAYDKADLRKAQERRVLPTCPPTLEYDDTTKLRHFSYRTTKGVAAPRLPHHAALFAYTRWTNLYSPHQTIMWGDIISGPVGPQFSLDVEGRELSGIRDIAVLPERERADGGRPVPGARVPFFSHTKYWMFPTGWKPGASIPHHIATLRRALNLKSG